MGSKIKEYQEIKLIILIEELIKKENYLKKMLNQ